MEKLEHYVETEKSRLGVDELDATTLPDEALVEICRFIVSGPLAIVAQVTDTDVMTLEAITAHRLEQAAILEKNLADYLGADGA